MRTISRSTFGFVALALGYASACGDSTSPNTGTMSPTEARAVASALFSEISRAVGSTTPSGPSSGATQSTIPTFTATINAQCSQGGSLKGTWELTNSVNSAGTGTISGAVTVTAAECVVNTGERTLSANGGYAFAFQAAFTNSRLSSNFLWDASGTLNWTGGSCTLDYTIEVTPQGRKKLAGTICGVDVTGETI